MESSLCPPSPGIDPFLSLGSWSIRQCSPPCRSVYLWSIRQCIPLGALRTLGSEPLTVLLSVGDPLGLLRSILVLPQGTPWSPWYSWHPLILINIALTWIPMDSDCQSARQRWQGASFLWNKGNFTFKWAKIFCFLPHDKRDGVGSSWMRRRRKLMETPKRFKVGRLSGKWLVGWSMCRPTGGGRQN